MKNDRKTELKVGITVTVAILFFLWVFGWAKNYSLADSRKEVSVLFDNVAGLEIGDQATVNGVRKGFVESVTIHNDGVHVILSFDSDTKLQSDASFSVTMLDLMGGKRVEVYPGLASSELDYTKTHQGQFVADIPKVMELVGNFSGSIPSIMNKVDSSLTALNNLVSDIQMQNSIKNSVSNLEDISVKLNAMINENRNGIKTLVQNSVDLTNETKVLIGDNKELINSTLRDVNTLLQTTDRVVKEIEGLLTETKNKNNSLGKALYDEKLISDLQETLTTVKELTKVLVDQLKGEGVNVNAKIDLF
ncbi:MAG: MCE family protein [Ignavibacteriales bacterium]|nr:hypothetical protein [Ignavibacteriaceae bacterium]MCK6613066.1 MlaD family protein [Ignavibacteriaceae bacterium]QOJ29245.1 MAG: MCE family protein [Ignavibacteriales bacterium]